jgi:tetratricopeptide (TPR) repeat protein
MNFRMYGKVLVVLALVAGCAAAQDESALRQRVQERSQAIVDLLSAGVVYEGTDGLLKSSGPLDNQQSQLMQAENKDRQDIFAFIAGKSRVPVEQIADMYAKRAQAKWPRQSVSLGMGSCKLVPAKNVDVARLFEYFHQGLNYAMHKKYDFALKEFQQALIIDKNFLDLNQNIGSAQLALKHYAEAEAAFKEEAKLIDCLMGLNENQLSAFGYFIEVEDKDPVKRKKEQAEKLKAKLPEAKATVNYNLACIYSREGNKDAGIDSLKKAVQAGFKDRNNLKTDPDLAFLRSTPEFRQVLLSVSQ